MRSPDRMRNWLRSSAIVMVVAAVAVAVTVLTVRQTAAQAPATYRAPRTVDGHPDLNGIWQAVNTANWDLEDHPAQAQAVLAAGALLAVPAGTGVVEGGAIPYQPWALARKKDNFAKRMYVDPLNRTVGDPEVKCFLPGVPRATYEPFPFQIVQGTNQITIAYELSAATRVIDMAKPPPSPVETWMGYSVGHWEGETLVVDVTGLNDQSWLDRAGNFHSTDLHVVERYTATSPYHLNYEATLEDPKVFTRPWKISMPLYRRMEKNAEIREFRCVEFVEPLIYGPLSKPRPAGQ